MQHWSLEALLTVADPDLILQFVLFVLYRLQVCLHSHYFHFLCTSLFKSVLIIRAYFFLNKVMRINECLQIYSLLATALKAVAKRILKEASCASAAFSLWPEGLWWILAALSLVFQHSKSRKEHMTKSFQHISACRLFYSIDVVLHYNMSYTMHVSV